MLKLWLLTVSLGLSLFASPVRAAVGAADAFTFSPHWNFQTFETEHFRITYPDFLKPLLNRTAAYLEDAHRDLSPLFRWSPEYKIQVMLADNTDTANGLAGAVGRVGMILYMTPPDNASQLAYYDDWLRTLIYHEYTHILNVDTYRGIYRPIRNFLFGDTTRPNNFWQPWMLEGLAVYIETQKTRGGRGRSPFYEMILRTAVEDQILGKRPHITLDQLTGPTPFYPAFESRYLYGYYLMNEVVTDVHERALRSSFDNKDKLESAEDSLGILSYRSGQRFPFFINGNLHNITGNDWYFYWDKWLEKTKNRMESQLAQIKSRPLSQVERLTQNGFDVEGSATSHDGKWLVYQQASNHRRAGLYLKNLKSGKVTRLFDRIGGSGLVFTPDSRFLIYSAFRRVNSYETKSDLAAYNLYTGKNQWLSQGMRFREPDLSPSGKELVFRYHLPGRSGLATAPLNQKDGKLSLGKVRKLYLPPLWDLVSSPKYLNENTVVFSHHRNGHFSEEIRSVSTQENTPVKTLVEDSFFNRYPVVHQGQLYFVSNRNGVDNLYLYRPEIAPGRPHTLLTNLTTGLRFVSFPTNESRTVYADTFASGGYDLAKVEINPLGIPPSSVDVDQKLRFAVAPLTASEKIPEVDPPKIKGQSSDYSVFPSLWPRRWSPLTTFLLNSREIYLGGGLQGFDTTRRYEYNLEAGHNLRTRTWDGYFNFQTAVLGPILDLSVLQTTDSVVTSDTGTRYDQDQSGGFSVSFPFRYTFSTLTPSLGLSFDRSFRYFRDAGSGVVSSLGVQQFVPVVTASLVYNDSETSLLAIAPERGRRLSMSAQRYQDDNGPSHKGFMSWTENLYLGKHSVLSSTLSASGTLSASTFSDANVTVDSTSLGINHSIREVSLRGYNGIYRGRHALAAALELKVPLIRLYRGIGTNPIFFENLVGQAYGEAVHFPQGLIGSQSSYASSSALSLTSAGAGLSLEGQLFGQFFGISVYYNRGFNLSYGAINELGLGLALPGLVVF